MDAKYSEPLKYQIWSLKVSIHCEGCRRKVKKVLRSIDGVFTTTIDPQQQKVTVTGSVGVETVIRKLVKAGKHAEVWPENLTGKNKPAKKNEKREQESLENHAESNLKKKEIKISNKCNGEKKNKDSKTGSNMPEKYPVSNQAPGQDRKSGQSEEGSGKKKKKKGQSVGNGNNGLSAPFNNAHAHTGSQFQMNISPTRQHSYPYADSTYYYHPLLYFSTYNNLYPMGTMNVPSYYVPSLPYKSSGLEYDPYYQVQSTPLVSFEIFSDENVNCCSIM